MQGEDDLQTLKFYEELLAFISAQVTTTSGMMWKKPDDRCRGGLDWTRWTANETVCALLTPVNFDATRFGDCAY